MDFKKEQNESKDQSSGLLTTIDYVGMPPITVIKPKNGAQYLDQNDCVDTVARFPNNGWIPVQYDEKCIVRAELYAGQAIQDNPGVSPGIDLEFSHAFNMNVYRHHLGNYVNTCEDGSELWSAFDIPFNPEWKRIVAQYMHGLTTDEMAIVRLLVEHTNNSLDYISLYMFSHMISDEFAEMRRHERQKQEDAEQRLEKGWLTYDEYKALIHPEPLKMVYDEKQCLDLGGEYKAIIQAFRYCYELNHRSPFSIIEQLYDVQHNGEQRELLSKLSPKTEIREEFNIFSQPGYPESIFTNYLPQIFICTYENGSFVIRKKR